MATEQSYLTMAILAYHEAENLRWLLPALKDVLEPLQLGSIEYLVVDSKEPTDDTEEVCEQFGARYVNQEEPGFGGAYRTAIEEARGTYFATIDADGSQDYRQLPKLVTSAIAGKDLAIGSRYVDGGSTDDFMTSQLMSKFLQAMFSLVAGQNIHDFSGNFRVCRTQDLKALHLVAENFDVMEELVAKLRLEKGAPLDVAEIPISFRKREIGESKRSLGKFIIDFGRMWVYVLVLRIMALRGPLDVQKQDMARKIADGLCGGAFVAATALTACGVARLVRGRMGRR